MSTPMFPLGSAFLPGEVVPLRVFEDRYVLMMKDLLASDDSEMVFGSVLIERGSEVGGTDVRRPLGVFVEVDQILATAEGGYSIIGHATQVLEVMEWLDDSPYPRAMVREHEESQSRVTDAVVSEVVRLSQMTRLLLQEIGELHGVPTNNRSFPELTDLAGGRWRDDVTSSSLARAVWVLARHVPVGPEDRYGFLSATSVEERMHRIAETVAHAREIIAFRRGGDD